ncbi:MAG: D-glycerate dehydrogenase [SAR202 cluster bacterium Io17-Chloro-G4]|nr:MAG: D-glycerate dehydrogenase [SAR202 cluster bacterium Io17-Chloro-G4]
MINPQVFVSRRIFPEALDLLSQVAEVEVWPEELPPNAGELENKIANADGVLTTIMDRVDAPLLAKAPRLKVISQLAVGLDNVDVAEASRRGILVGYTPGILSKATADVGFALLLSAARRIGESERWVRAGGWEMSFHPMYWLGAEVNGATLGIVGLGQIGLEMAKRGLGFDMRVIYHSRTRKLELEERYGLEYVAPQVLLSESDFVSLHVPLTPETRHFIGEQELRMMKSTAILINLARGPVVDAKALYTALNEKWIQAAALDVTDPEPISPDDPLLTLSNLVISPHIGSASVTTRKEMCMMAARNLVAGLKGERLENCANPELYPSKGL